VLIKSEKNGHTLEHDEEQHTYFLDNKPLVGVTTIISQGYPKSQRIVDWQVKKGAEWAIQQVGKMELLEILKAAPTAYKIELDEAAGIGTIVHDLAYNYTKFAKCGVEQHKLHPKYDIIVRCFEQFMEWTNTASDEIVALEELVCSPSLTFAGRFDRLSKRNGVITLSDYKTSSGFYISQFIQLAAYAIAIEEWMGIEVEDIEIVRFDKKSGTLSTRNLLQVAQTVGLKPKTVMRRLKSEFASILETVRFKEQFDRYIRK
jgi:hypothetical protein